jgi:hypothetical protein
MWKEAGVTQCSDFFVDETRKITKTGVYRPIFESGTSREKISNSARP